LAGVDERDPEEELRGVDLDFQTSTTQEGDGSESRFTALLGAEHRRQRQRDARVSGASARPFLPARSRLYMNGWSTRAATRRASRRWPLLARTNGFRPTQAAVDALFAGTPDSCRRHRPGLGKQRQRNLLHPDGHAF